MPTTVVDVPLTIQPDAAELVAELGMQKELDQMLDEARRRIPNLVRLNVIVREMYDTDTEPGILIEAYWNPEGQPSPREVYKPFGQWKLAAFPPEVGTNFTLLLIDERNYVR